MKEVEEKEKVKRLQEAARNFGCELEEEAAAKMVTLFHLVGQANVRLGLTAITDWEEALVKHFLDSLAPLAVGLLPPADGRVADLGSGGGFPGLVLAAVFPAIPFTLIEATRKKAAFLAEAASSLGLANVRVWAKRAEEVGKDEGREVFVFLSARAVAPLPVLVELAHPLLLPGGRLVAWKGPEAFREIEAASSACTVLGAEVRACLPYVLPEGHGRRFLVVIEKTRPTPAGFPRRPGMAAKRPL